MRKNNFLIVIALFTTALFTACKKDSGSGISNSNGDYYVSFKRDGTDIKMTAVAQFTLYDSLGANLDACGIAAGHN